MTAPKVAIPPAARNKFRQSATLLKQKYMSCSHCQKLGQLADLASDWLLYSQSGGSLLFDTTLDNEYNS